MAHHDHTVWTIYREVMKRKRSLKVLRGEDSYFGYYEVGVFDPRSNEGYVVTLKPNDN